MFIEIVVQLFVASAILLGSPGPVPLSLAATGISFGFKAGLDYLKGILLGLLCVMLLTAIGLAFVVKTSPALIEVLKWGSAAYMCYVAYKIASFGATLSNSENCPSLKDGLFFNLINPKAYAAFIAINTQFTLPIDGEYERFVTTGIVCLIAGAIVDILWLAIGGYLKPILVEPRLIKRVRMVFAASLVLIVLIGVLQ